jgi:hypothetical protein
MQAAPEVMLALRPSAHWRRVSGLLALAAACSAVAWVWSSAWSLWRLGLGLFLAACAMGVFMSLGKAGAAVGLHWTRHTWRLDEGRTGRAPLPGDLDVLLDLGSGLLLRFRPSAGRGRARTLALAQADHPGQWHALRCALYSPRPSDSAPARSPTA